jgi:hypothetical protein
MGSSTIDYDALAQQNGGSVQTQQPQAQAQFSGQDIDYDSLAQQAGGSPAQSFTTPNGTTLTPGQTVTHSSGVTGTVIGQHPDTGKAIVQWNQKHPGQQYGVEGTIRANDPQNTGTAVARWAEQVANDVKYGTDFTGIGKVLKKMGAHGVYVGNPEAVGDFMASIPLGLLRTGKGMAEAAGSQSAGGNWQAVKDMVGGIGQTAEMPSAVIAPENAELEELAGQSVDHAGELASSAAKAGKTAASKAVSKATAPVVKKVAQAKAVANDLLHPEMVGQDELQSAVRNIAQKTAEEAGPRGGMGATGNPTNPVEPDTASSIRDVFRNLAKAVETRAQAAYQELDAATGGNVSRFDKELKNVENAIRNSTGVDETNDAALEARKASIIEKQEEAFKQAEANGVPRETVEQARADWRQKSALNDLDTQLKKATPVSSKTADTRIDPNKFRTRITSMHDSGRLHEAVGADNADALRDAAVKAAETQQKALTRQKIAKGIVKATPYVGATAAGAGAIMHALE